MSNKGDYTKASKTPLLFAIFFAVAAAALAANSFFPGTVVLSQVEDGQGVTLLKLIAIIATILAAAELAMLFTQWLFARHNKPPVEARMIARLYKLCAVLAIVLSVAAGFNMLASIGSFFALFGGMLLGWSLQAPVSGFAAYLLVSLKRPFRPGDRVQFPNLGLTGDVKETGPMYTVLDQVGGSIGSEEAVGRYILVPNALLFSQVVINYTVLQEAAYMLDEVVVRITYDSDWETAERVLLRSAEEVTKDIILATGVRPYIRSDLYDYGVYLRLRYQTIVKNRAEIGYKITKKIFQEIQCTPSVDLAIPFVYSYRAGADKRDEPPRDREAGKIRQIAIDNVRRTQPDPDPSIIAELSQSIAANGLLQPIMVIKNPNADYYDIVAGDQRFEACKSLGWRTIPAVILPEKTEPGTAAAGQEG